MIYLASPYSHPDPSVKAFRFDAVTRTAALLIAGGEVLFCPIAHSHPMAAVEPAVDGQYEQWQEMDETILAVCDEMWIVALDGWQQSRGVRAEAEFATSRGIPVKLIDRDGTLLGEL